MSNVYYRIFLDRDNEVDVVCMQDFDESDYDQSRFLTEKKFKEEYDAVEWLRKVPKNHLPEKICNAITEFLSTNVKNILDDSETITIQIPKRFFERVTNFVSQLESEM